MSDIIDLEQKPSRRLWLFAGVAALALHLGGAALAVAHLKNVNDEDSFGAPAIEVGLELSSPKSEQTDLPPGPDQEESVASPPVPEQQAEAKEIDLPKARPTEEAEADRSVTPNDVKKPVEEDTKVAKVQTEASPEMDAIHASAVPNIDSAPKAARSVAPAIGTGESARRARVTWEKQLMAHFNRHKRYPSERESKAAEITVSFELDRMGHVLSASIVKGSGDPVFDQAALSMLHRSDPVPRPPPLVADQGLIFTLPVNFTVKDKS